MEGRFKHLVGVDKELLDKIYSEKGSYIIYALYLEQYIISKVDFLC